MLSLAGGVTGVALSVLASKLLRVEVQQMLTTQLGSGFVFSLNLDPDARVLAYALAISVIAGAAFGLSPALQFTKPELATSLNDESTSFGHGLRRSHLRSLLICGQVAVSMLLLTCSGLLVRGLMQSQSANPGFDTHGVFLLVGDYGDNAPTSVERFQRIVRGLGEEPAVANIGQLCFAKLPEDAGHPAAARARFHEAGVSDWRTRRCDQ